MRNILAKIILTSLATLCGVPALAAWPEKPITLIIPWAAGGSTDILGRTLAQHLSDALGQPVIVDNRAGAAGNLGSTAVARAKADGYTLLINPVSVHAMNPALYASMPFKAIDDFTPIAQLANVPNVLVVNAALPVSTLREFLDYARANPGKLNYASGGAGSTNHLSAVMLERAAGLSMVHIPYKGGAPAVMATVAGETQLLVTAPSQVMPYVRTGKLKALALTDSRRSDLVPGVPLLAETFRGLEMDVWYGVFGPASMPAEVVERLNLEINKVMARTDVRTRMESLGVDVVSGTPAQLGSLLQRDARRYEKLIRELGIKGE